MGGNLTSKVEYPYTGKNLFDKNSQIELTGQYRGYTTGAIYNNSDYIGIKVPINSSTTYTISTDLGNNFISNLCFFNSNFNYISGIAFNTMDRTFTTPSNCAYITLAVYNAYNWLQIEKGTIATSYEPYIAGTLGTAGKNLLDISDFNQTINGVTVTCNNGIVHCEGNATAVTNIYIPLKTNVTTDGASYCFSGKVTGLLPNNISSIRLLTTNNAGGTYSFAGTYVTIVGGQTKFLTEARTETYKYLLLYFNPDQTVNFDLFYQLEKGTTATEYEPYTVSPTSIKTYTYGNR